MMNEKLKNLINRYGDRINANDFSAFVYEAIKLDLLGEALDVFRTSGVLIRAEVVTEELWRVYVERHPSLSQREREQHELELHDTVNRIQLALMKGHGWN